MDRAGSTALRTTVVIATRDRAAELCAALERLEALPERPAVTVVDNASADGTLRRVGHRFPFVRLIGLPEDRGASARTIGARLARTPWIAFCDDGSWWSADALARAARYLARSPRLALVAACAKKMAEPGGPADPAPRGPAAGPLPGGPGASGPGAFGGGASSPRASGGWVSGPRASDPGVSGTAPSGPGASGPEVSGPRASGPEVSGPRASSPAVLGFPGCAAVVRRDAYLDVGGFHPLLCPSGGERLLSYDLAAAGWDLAYQADVVAYRQPAAAEDAAARRALDLRDDALIGWLRRPMARALGFTADLARRAAEDDAARRALRTLCAGLPTALRERHQLPPAVEARIRLLEDCGSGTHALPA
ncbi:glycosyltransferase [Actinospica sp. MGRD01-02]|uniref:Glycosyltransferase n=1 Tax=Actinospica acidithermotolerans TaxID=2828514 RepID=A0A941E9H2_9ACTN|nr:glycosyltransferase family 2 protein [Actinospica acidithermotolerans]MBR7825009.1 glycosyltransferase [Actinospica acidithermotolerans]